MLAGCHTDTDVLQASLIGELSMTGPFAVLENPSVTDALGVPDDLVVTGTRAAPGCLAETDSLTLTDSLAATGSLRRSHLPARRPGHSWSNLHERDM